MKNKPIQIYPLGKAVSLIYGYLQIPSPKVNDNKSWAEALVKARTRFIRERQWTHFEEMVFNTLLYGYPELVQTLECRVRDGSAPNQLHLQTSGNLIPILRALEDAKDQMTKSRTH
jgi:hypothetical protein